MTVDPRQFWLQAVLPALKEWSAARGVERRARIALIELDNLVEHMIQHRMPGAKVSFERDKLGMAEPALRIARDVHDTHKHGQLRRPTAIIKKPPSTRSQIWHAGCAPFGSMPFGTIEIELWVTDETGKAHRLSDVIHACVQFWAVELVRDGFLAASELADIPPSRNPWGL